MSIDWVFFDMGGVLVDDEPAMLLIYRRLYERCEASGCFRSHDEIFSLREELIGKGDGSHWHTVGKMHLGDNGWHELYVDLIDELRLLYAEVNLPYVGVGDMLARTADEFKLGLAANQLTECRSILLSNGWMDYFEVFGISEEVGYRKPQPEFFHWLLREAKAEPERCIFVGDRVDNDIRPAKALGLKTILFRMKPDYRNIAIVDDFARAYVESHKRAAIKFVDPADDSETPDCVAHSPADVIKGIEMIVSS